MTTRATNNVRHACAHQRGDPIVFSDAIEREQSCPLIPEQCEWTDLLVKRNR